jgi:hypothetical protein
VPCARYFSFEANIYVRGFLDMRVLPFSYPHPFLPPSLPWVALRNSRPLLWGTSSGKLLLEILFGLPFSKFCFGPGRSTRSPWSADVTSTRYRKCVFVCVFCGRGVVPVCDVGATSDFIRGGGCFCFSLAVTRHNFLCITLYDFVLSCVLLNHSFHYTLL